MCPATSASSEEETEMGEKLTAPERCTIRHHNPVLHSEFLDARAVVMPHRL